MESSIDKGCGLDVHQATVVACIKSQSYPKQIRTFGTTTEDLEELKQWLKEAGITHVAMESTGVYWKPVFNVLEDEQWEILLVNARHIKNISGQKTDVKDAEWLCNLLRSGWVRGSFIPPEDIRELRSITRRQKNLQEHIQTEKNRIHKSLQECNIKITQVLSDIFGVTGMKILTDLSNGITQAETLAKHMEKNKRLMLKKEQAVACLKGKLGRRNQHMLKLMLGTIAFYQQQIEELNQDVDELLKPYQATYELLQTIPGVKAKAAKHIIAELSGNMDAFPDEKHISSWAGLCPGNNESAGKKKSSRLRHGNNHLRVSLTECAWAAVKAKDTYFRAKYYQLVVRMGPKKALIAIAHKILISCYHIMKYQIPFKELGADYFAQGKKDQMLTHYKKKLRKLGYQVELLPIEA